MKRFQEIERHPFDDDAYLGVLTPKIISEVGKNDFSLIVTNKKLFRLALEKELMNQKIDFSLIDQNNPLEARFLKGQVCEVMNRFKQLGVVRDLSKSVTNTECFFANLEEITLYRAIVVLKKIEQNGIEQATLSNLITLLENQGGGGRSMIHTFRNLPVASEEEGQEAERISIWFLNDYYDSMSGGRWAPKTYEYTSHIRSKLNQLLACLNSKKTFVSEQLTPIKGDMMKGVFVLDVSSAQKSEVEFILQEFKSFILRNKIKTTLVWDVFGLDLEATEIRLLLLNAHNVQVFSFKENQTQEPVSFEKNVAEEKKSFYQQIEEENLRQLIESSEEIDFEEAHKEYLSSVEEQNKKQSEFELLLELDDFEDEIISCDMFD